MQPALRRGQYLPPGERFEYIRRARRELLEAGAAADPAEDRETAIRFWMEHRLFRSRRSTQAAVLVAWSNWQARCDRKRRVPRSIRLIVIGRAGGVCHYCRLPVAAEDFVMDHVIPVARGGKSRPDNLVAACWDCNADKSDLLLSEWLPECWREYLPPGHRMPARFAAAALRGLGGERGQRPAVGQGMLGGRHLPASLPVTDRLPGDADHPGDLRGAHPGLDPGQPGRAGAEGDAGPGRGGEVGRAHGSRLRGAVRARCGGARWRVSRASAARQPASQRVWIMHVILTFMKLRCRLLGCRWTPADLGAYDRSFRPPDTARYIMWSERCARCGRWNRPSPFLARAAKEGGR